MTPEEEPPPPRGNVDWTRWPLLIGAFIGIGAGVYLLQGSGTPGAVEFAAFSLILVGGISFGAFIESRK